MRKVAVLVVLIIFSGCVQTQDGKITIDISSLKEGVSEAGIGGVSFKELSENPEKYVNKEITAKGKMIFTMSPNFLAETTGSSYLEDDQGYRLLAILPGEYSGGRSWDIGNRVIYAQYAQKTYSIRGNYTFYEYCSCESRYVDSLGNWYYERDVKVDKCPKSPQSAKESRCAPNSIKKVYYLDPIEIE